MKPIRIPALAPERLAELEEMYRSTRDARLRTRAQMVLLAAERRLTAAEIAEIVRASEETVRRWLKRYLAEGVEGLRDVPHPGAPRKVTEEYRELLVEAVRRRPRSLGLPFSVWTVAAAGRLHGRANRHPGRVRDRAGAPEGGRHRAEPPPAHHHQPGPRVRPQKKAIEEARDDLEPEDHFSEDHFSEDHFYYADEFNLSWMPTLTRRCGARRASR
jgi:transposase